VGGGNSPGGPGNAYNVVSVDFFKGIGKRYKRRVWGRGDRIRTLKLVNLILREAIRMWVGKVRG